jgi:hypothetical protein
MTVWRVTYKDWSVPYCKRMVNVVKFFDNRFKAHTQQVKHKCVVEEFEIHLTREGVLKALNQFAPHPIDE